MLVGVDARCLNTTHPRGMGKYVSEFISHVESAAQISWQFFADRPEITFHTPPRTACKIDLFDMKGYRFHSWEQLGLPLRANRNRVDLLHCTATTMPVWQPVPTVVTVHDTLPWKSPVVERYERWYRHWLTPQAYRRSAAVITISQSSRRDILDLWPWLEQKLHVIPHGVSDVYLNTPRFPRSTVAMEAAVDVPYVLYIGGAIERKRFSWALDIFTRLENANVRLLVCGFNDPERRLASERLAPNLKEKVRFLPYVSEAEMPSLYQDAALVIYPTLYEGFGLPALEAQAVGTPVLFSDLASLSELKGPGAETLPTDDLEAWVTACRRILSQRSELQNSMPASRTWARRFSWGESAERHVDVYRSVLKKSHPQR